MAVMYHPPVPAAIPVRVRTVPPAFGELALPPGEVHVWVAAAGAPCPTAPLSADEAKRAARYAHPRPREQFVRCRGLLRATLAGYLRCDPADVRFAYTPDGKPELAGMPGFHFNVTHTDGVAAVAVSNVPVGIDAENTRPVDVADALVARFFAAAEHEQYRPLPPDLREAGFVRGWACKEAVLKGVGCGARGLERCVVDMDPRQPARVVALAGPAAALGPTWGLACWHPVTGVTAAVALCGSGEFRLEFV
ncbi:MAG: 4'-phosphopantetheinyl transferase family protein [Fimbriiglobus sp.]